MAHSKTSRRLTRRHVLKTGASALGGGTALLAGAPAAEAALAQGQAPAVLSGTQTGRPFRGLVRHGTTLDVQERRLRALDPRQVVIRSLAVMSRRSCPAPVAVAATVRVRDGA